MEAAVLIVSALITSSISAVLGMGGGVILLGIMAIIVPEGYMVIALHGIIQLFSNTTRSILFRDHINWKITQKFFIGAVVGLITSGFIIYTLVILFNVKSASQIKFDMLKPMIGVFIIWYLFFKNKKKESSNKSFVWVGGVSGVSAVFIGATGPLIAPFFLNDKLSKNNIIASKAICQVVSHVGKIPIFIYFFQVNYINEASVLVPLIIAVFIGTNFGKSILNFIPEKLFKKLFRYTLLIIAIRLVLIGFI